MIISSLPIDIWKMSLKQLYNALLDHNILKGLDNSIIPLHVEIKLPWIDWSLTWKCLRHCGICGLAVSTIYQVIPNILPTHERLAHLSESNDSNGMSTLSYQSRRLLAHFIPMLQKPRHGKLSTLHYWKNPTLCHYYWHTLPTVATSSTIFSCYPGSQSLEWISSGATDWEGESKGFLSTLKWELGCLFFQKQNIYIKLISSSQPSFTQHNPGCSVWEFDICWVCSLSTAESSQ